MPAGPADPNAANTPLATSVWHRYPGSPQSANGTGDGTPATGTPTIVASAGSPSAGATTEPVTTPPVIAGPVWSMLHGCFCDSNTCAVDGCDVCGCTFGNRFYISGDYLLWWIKGSNTPPLVTRGSAGDPVPGALGLPGTTVLFGGGSVENNPFSGGRLSAGYWFGDQHLLGFDFGGFFLGQQGTNFSATSLGNPILARPIVDATTGLESAELVAGPNVLAGTVSVTTRSQMWGYEANLRSNLGAGQFCGIDYYVDGILGFRALGLDESLNVNENLLIVGGTANTAPFAGETFNFQDRFATENRFYGGQVGFLSEFRWNRWVLDLNTKVAVGPTQEMVQINGASSASFHGATTNFNGGLLALPSNIGQHTRDKISWAPELGLNLGYQCTDHIRLIVGYNFLYWSSVVRPGNQIDRSVNPNNVDSNTIASPARPQFGFNSTDFWAQGVNFGLEFRY
jgi:hypothetical protein